MRERECQFYRVTIHVKNIDTSRMQFKTNTVREESSFISHFLVATQPDWDMIGWSKVELVYIR